MIPMNTYALGPLPDELTPADPRLDLQMPLRMEAEAGDDLFLDPATGLGVSQLKVVGAWRTDEQFIFSARLRVDFRTTFDSGILLGWFAGDAWFKVCAEQDPQGRARVVSVVTRGRSDDANGAFINTEATYLRLARLGRVFALHSSSDSHSWDLVRLFEMSAPTRPVFVGVAAQSPEGDGTTVLFDQMQYSEKALVNVRGTA